MKHSTKSGKAATAALSQPQQNNTAKKQPTPEQIEEALKLWIGDEVRQFACDLEIARRVYRSNPELVKPKRYPEPWRTMFIEAYDGEIPNDRGTQKAPSIERLRKTALPDAIETATAWANKEEATQSATNSRTGSKESEHLTTATTFAGDPIAARARFIELAKEACAVLPTAEINCLACHAAIYIDCATGHVRQRYQTVTEAYQREQEELKQASRLVQ
jgi:hypothetical protein